MNGKTCIICFFFVLVFIVSFSCKSQDKPISITPDPVFSEEDTQQSSVGNTIINRYDYFLVKGNLKNKQVIKEVVNDFVNKSSNKECNNYANYIMFFYRESPNVNRKKILKKDCRSRYQIFTYNKESDFIASFSCWSSKPSDHIDFAPKYK